jgi:putative transposase
VDKIVEEHKDICSSPTRVSMHYQLNHSIGLTHGAPLPNIPMYKIYFMENEEIKHQTQELIMKGHIIPSSSLCGSPIVMVQKKDGTR